MKDIDWCFKKSSGISLVEPGKNLADSFILKSEDSLKEVTNSQSKDWKIITAYYAMYQALYAVLARIGVKCEIHECTIKFMRKFLSKYFTEEECDFIKTSCNARNNVQYYTNKNIEDSQRDLMIKKTPEFVVKCKNILQKITEQDINSVREEVIAFQSNIKKIKKK